MHCDVRFLNESIVFELKTGKRVCKMFKLYRLPSHLKDDFEIFIGKLELTFNKVFDNNPFLVVALEDFNAKSDLWSKNNDATHEGSKIANRTSQSALKQAINQPTHLLSKSSSCIDLLFTSQPNL